jgi:hypothetical protein
MRPALQSRVIKAQARVKRRRKTDVVDIEVVE